MVDGSIQIKTAFSNKKRLDLNEIFCGNHVPSTGKGSAGYAFHILQLLLNIASCGGGIEILLWTGKVWYCSCSRSPVKWYDDPTIPRMM
jgi:hypothetical protein